MAQIIKHRRGLIGGVKNLTARNGELIIASGSISDLSGPFVFIGSPNVVDEGVAGAFNTVSKLYTGTAAPTITAATYGSALDGTPYYASGNKSLYILNNSNVGNSQIDLTGNIEGNTISGVTINNLQSTNITASFVSGSFIGDATGLYNIPATGVTGLNLSKIYSGSVQVSTDSDSGTITLSGGTVNIENDTYINSSTLYVNEINGNNGGHVNIYSEDYTQLNYNNQNYFWVDSEGAWTETNTGNIGLSSYNSGQINLNTNGGEGDVNILNNSNDLYINSNAGSWSFKKEGDIVFPLIQTNGRTGNGEGIQFKKSSNQKVITTEAGTADSNTVERMVIAGGDSYYDGSAYQGEGGDLYLWAGKGNNGGDIKVDAGEAVNGQGGTTKVRGGYSLNGDGGFVEITAGNSSNATGGNVEIYAGTGQTNGRVNVHSQLNVNANASITGSLVVTDGAAFIDQGVVSQNSNVLLTSGSNLIIQDGGSATVDYIQGNTHEWNYLALNGGADGAPDVELSSTGDISLWAEGGTVNVTGSLRVTGDIIFSGSINLGDYTGDTINFNGEVSSSILPFTGSAFDLGSSGQTWNNVWAENAHFTNIDIGAITLNSLGLPGNLDVTGTTTLNGDVFVTGLTETRVTFAGEGGQLVDDGSFTFAFNNDYNNNVLEAPIINATSNGNGTNFLIGDDMWLGDINESNATRFMGANDNNYARIYLGASSTNNYLDASGGDITLQSDNTLYLQSQNSTVEVNSYDGSVNINRDSNNNISIGGHTYIEDRNLYVNRIWDYTNENSMLELYGYGTNNSEWWESGTGRDTTLQNNDNGSNLNIIQTSNGKVNITATNGSVNLNSTDGFNVTGSMVVSDGSGVFNSSLIVSNSDLTLDGGTNQHMNDGAHLYFDTCVDIYYDNGDGNLIFYNDCNNFQFRNNVSITGSLTLSSGLYTDNVYGATNSNNALHLNGGIVGAPNVELSSNGQISLWSEGSGDNYAINMTGSVHVQSDMDVSGSLYVGNITNYNNDINNGGIYIDSGNYTEISYNDEEVYLGVDSNGIWGYSNSGQNILTSNAGDTTIQANNGYSVNITTDNIHLGGATAVTGAFTVSSGSMTSLGGDLYVSGNLQVLGSSTNVNIQSQTVDIGDNIILVNAYSPFDRYAGLAAYDSGSSGASGSFLWDSTSDYWLIVNANGNSSKLIGTTASTGGTGTEISLTSGTFPIASSSNTIGDSLLTFAGTTLSYNTNKFTIDSETGDTYISGNLTLDGGGTDNGSKTSQVTFRNDDNILGFVSTTETTNELDGILGYNNSTGVLEFSSLIDGGTY